MRLLFVNFAAAATLLLAACGSADAAEHQGTKAVLTCDFRSEWRYGTPAFAADEFGKERKLARLLFVGEMRPRGTLVLRHGGTPGGEGPEMAIPVRSADLDITPQLELAGAHHWPPGGEMKLVKAEELPALKAYYEPDLPAEIALGPKNRSAVLLFEIGEGKQDEWAEGRWSVALRFKPGKLPVDLRPGMGSVMAPRSSAVVYKLEFEARKARTEEDRLNLLFFRYKESRTLVWEAGGYGPAIDALTAILKARPDRVNLRLGRAKLLTYVGREDEALKENSAVMALARGGKLPERIRVPMSPRATPQEAIQWLERNTTMWKSSRASRQKRLEALRGLLKGSADEALRKLRAVLQPGGDHLVKVEAVRLLGELGEKRAGPPIVEAMGEKWFLGALRAEAHKTLSRLYPDARPGFDDDRIRTEYRTVVAFWKKHVKAAEGPNGYLQVKKAPKKYIRPLAWGTFISSELTWGAEDANAIASSGGPDGIYRAFVPSGLSGTDQLKQGKVVFIDGRMPIDLVFWFRPTGENLTLFAGEKGKPFTDHLSCDVWYGGGQPQSGEVDVKVLGVQLPERSSVTWDAAVADRRRVILEDREDEPDTVSFRVRVAFKKDIWKKTPAGEKPGERTISLGLSIDLGAIPGNEKLAAFLAARRGRPKTVPMPRLTFRLVRADSLDDGLRLDYQLWRVRSALPPALPASLAQREDAYRKILALRPKHERSLLAHARVLEKMGRFDDAAAVLKRLRVAVLGGERDVNPLEQLAPASLKEPIGGEGEIAMSPAGLAKVIDLHVKRLEKRAAESKEKGR